MPIHKYQRVVTPGPNGATLYFRNTETNDALELAELDGWHYVFVPDGVTVPEQHADIQWQDVTLTDALKEQIKAASRPCQLIAEAMQQRIRSVYSLEDEQYFARIGVGAALGVYAFQPGEQEALLAFGAHVEAVRQWGRQEREKIGL
jgi:hypothetical protein